MRNRSKTIKLSQKAITVVKESFSEWKEDNAARLAAALAYYTTFSIAPLMALVIAIAGLVGGREIVHDEVVGQVGRLLGEEGQLFIEDMLVSLSQPSRGLFAGAISVIVLIFGALGVFAELQNSLNTIWEVKPKPVKGVASSVGRLVRQRILSFSMVLAIGFVLLASLVLNAVLSALSSFVWASSDLPEWVTQVINGITTFLVITILFALIFKFLPDADIAWRDVWLGAVVTSLLFNLGMIAIGLYLGRSSVSSSFGAAGSLVLILIWVYYSAQIFFFGAEITQVTANEFGSRILPDEDAVKVTEMERAQEGIPHQESMEREKLVEQHQESRKQQETV